MKARGFWKPFIISLAATPICLVLGLGSAGTGHGDYILATILFPLTMPLSVFFDSAAVLFILAIAQFPIYGIILGLANLRNKLDVSIVGVLVIHLLAIFTCFLFLGEKFS